MKRLNQGRVVQPSPPYRDRMGNAERSRPVPTFVTEVLAEAVGQSRRSDPVSHPAGGPAGNARLTAWTGLLLLVLSLIELVTLLDMRGLISWHVVIGVLLIPPALLKTLSTGWRVLNYYRRRPTYTQAGPPPIVLRLLGPAVVATTWGLLGSGVLLLALGQDRSERRFVTAAGFGVNAITLHQAMFACWAVATGLHVLGRFVPALRLTIARQARDVSVPGASRRAILLLSTAALAAVAGPLALYAIGSWRSPR